MDYGVRDFDDEVGTGSRNHGKRRKITRILTGWIQASVLYANAGMMDP